MSGTALPRVGEQFGRYRIDGQIGFGGMGVVLAATDIQLGRKVALKVVAAQLAASEEFQARFAREAELMTRLDSPHVLTVYDHGVLDGTPWLATPYVSGGDIGKLLRQRGPMPLPMAATICAQVASALRDAHAVGIVHRDVKPGNVLMRGGEGEPFAYLCDFGIAATGETQMTQAGSVAGSWAYIAPERMKGAPGSPQTDIYALGCVLWCTLTGAAPYVGSDIEVAIAHTQAPVPQFPGNDHVTRQVNAVLAHSLAKDPAERYQDAEEFRRDLVALARIGELDTDVRRARLAPRPEVTAVRSVRKSRKAPVLVGGVAAAVLLGGGGVGWWALASGGDEKPDEKTKAWVAGDVDGDGKADLIFDDFSTADEPRVVINTLLSTGDSFGNHDELPDPEGADVIGDWNGDGQWDIVSAKENYQTEGLDVTITSEGKSWTMRLPKDGRMADGSASLADVDADGRDDLVIHYPTLDNDGENNSVSGLTVAVALSTEDGFGEPETWYVDPNLDWYGDTIVYGDLDGDDRADLVSVSTGDINPQNQGRNRYLTFARNTGDAFEDVGDRLKEQVPALQSWLRTSIADVDGDGVGELVASIPDRPAARIHVYDVGEDGIPAKPTLVVEDRWGGGDHSDPFAALDVDGDGDADLVVIRDATTKGIDVQVALADGGRFGDFETWYTWKCRNAACRGEELILRKRNYD